MKRLMSFVSVMFVGAIMLGCAPTASQLQKVLEDNPEVLFSVIEKHPDKFFQTVQKAQSQMRQGEEDRMMKEEMEKREEEFKTPKVAVIEDDRAYEGDKNAPVTIVEYSDFECPFCRKGHMTMTQLLKEYPGKVKIVFKNLPIERIHPHALIASKYYEAIALQDIKKAAEFKKEIFDKQREFTADGEKFLKSAAKKVGANLAKVQTDINSETVNKRIEADRAEAEKFEFSGTPGYLINGVSLRGAYPIEEFKKIIDRHLAEKK